MGRLIATTLVMLLFAAPSSAKSPIEETLQLIADSTTSWQNQSGSTMQLILTPDGSATGNYRVSGQYVNRATGFSCQGSPYPMAGWYYANTQTISFTVVWNNAQENCQSVTGWTGYIDLSTNPLTMKTDWNLAYQSGSGREIDSGSDTFTMLQSTVRESLLSQSD